jgi:2-polyprenyl-6-methoxyphenol hydroxylase-like FAD-dependent oxidoreductase
VIIVGAGVGGLSAAIGLLQSGIEVTVLEKQADPRAIETGGGFVLWHNGMRALQRLGLADQVRELGSVLSVADWQVASGRQLAKWPVGEMGRELGAPAVGIRRKSLQSVLLQGLGDGVLRLGVECTGFSVDREGVRVRLAGGEEDHADALIGADGLSSTIRPQLLGRSEQPRSARYSQSYAITDHRNELTDAGIFREIDGRGLRFFIFPVGGGDAYWAGAIRGTDGGGAPEPRPEVKSRVLERFRGWPDPVESLIAATPEDSILRREIVDRDPVKRWGAGPVTLLGDAAHPTTPNLGQGACQSMEDAVVLAKCLRDESEVAQALRDYEARRISRTSSFVRRARLIGQIGRWRNPLACVVRDQLVRVLVPGPALSQHRKDMSYEL